MSDANTSKRTRKILYKQDHGISHDKPNSDINVTPLVDVCLVLLIIFMVITPMLGRGKDVRLPILVEAAQHKEGDQVFVSIDDNGVYVNQDEYQTKDEFLHRLDDELKVAAGKAAAQGAKGPLLFLKGDRETNYGRVRIVMDWITQSESGISDVALVVALPQSGD